MTFDLAYYGDVPELNYFRIWASSNGGETFDHLLRTVWDRELSEFEVSELPVRPEASDFTNYELNISELAGQEVVIGFESVHNGFSQIVLDNLEFYNSSQIRNREMDWDEISLYPNPASDNISIQFKLQDKQEVVVSVVDFRAN